MKDESIAPGQPEPVVSAACPARLGAEVTKDDVTAVLVAEPHLLKLRELGMEMQGDGWLGPLFETTSTLNARLEPGRMNELMVFRATLGEQLSQASASLTEALLWQHVRQGVQRDAEHEMAQRAMAELTTYYLLSAGHSLANITARMLASDRALQLDLEAKIGKTFPVGTVEDQGHAIELTKDRAIELDRVAAGSSSVPLQGAAKSLRALVIDPAWKELQAARHLDYHRFRPQTRGAATGSVENPWKKGDGFSSLSFGYPQNPPDGEDLGSDRTGLAVRALLPLHAAAAGFEAVFSSYWEEIKTL